MIKLLLLIFTIINFVGAFAQDADSLSALGPDSIYRSNHFISKKEVCALVQKYQGVFDNNKPDTLSVTEKIIIIKIANAISYQEKLYSQPLFIHFFQTLKRLYLSKILEDLDFMPVGRSYYSAKHNLHFEGEERESSFEILE